MQYSYCLVLYNRALWESSLQKVSGIAQKVLRRYSSLVIYIICLVFIIIFKHGRIRLKVMRVVSIERFLRQHHTSCIDRTFVRLPTDNPTEYQYDATHSQTHLELSKIVDTLQPAWTIICLWIYDFFCLSLSPLGLPHTCLSTPEWVFVI